MAYSLDSIRYKPEKDLITHLIERFGLREIVEHFEVQRNCASAYEKAMATQIHLTPLLAPRLCTIVSTVKARLGIEISVELFVEQDPKINAFSHQSIGVMPQIVTLTSALVRSMTDDELHFVLGHELGHLAFEHHRARLVSEAIGNDERGHSRVPPLLSRRLETWSRLAELSADRAGFMAVHGRLDVAAATFFKLESGLGPEDLQFDLSGFIDQLRELERLKHREVLSMFSHPATPVRVRALQCLPAFVEDAPSWDVDQADPAIAELAKLMEPEPTEPLNVMARDFLLAGGFLAAAADGVELSTQRWDLLADLLLPFTSDPELEMTRLTSPEQAREVLKNSIEWLRANAGEERFVLYRRLAQMAAIDGHLHPGEQEFMLGVADALDVPRRSATETLFQALAAYIRGRNDWERSRS